MHLITKIGDRLGFGRRRDLFKQRLSVVTLLLLPVQQKSVRLEVVHLLVCLVDCADLDYTALLHLVECHKSISESLFGLVQTDLQVFLRCVGHIFLHLSVRRPVVFLFITSLSHNQALIQIIFDYL